MSPLEIVALVLPVVTVAAGVSILVFVLRKMRVIPPASTLRPGQDDQVLLKEVQGSHARVEELEEELARTKESLAFAEALLEKKAKPGQTLPPPA